MLCCLISHFNYYKIGGDYDLIEDNEGVVVYDIATDDGKKFCECRKTKYKVILSTKQGDISIMSLVEQVADPSAAYRKRKKKDKKACIS